MKYNYFTNVSSGEFQQSAVLYFLLFTYFMSNAKTTYVANINTTPYYSTIMSFDHIRSREQANYEAVIHRSVLV